MNKQKICIVCTQILKGSNKLFCSRKCYRKANLHLANERAYLDRLKENTDLEAEILYVKKHSLILKESIGYDSPFTSEYKDKRPYTLVD